MVSHPHVRRSLVIIAVVLSALVTACGSKHESFRYKLTVEVETPQGLRSGMSVIEIDVSQTGKYALATPEAQGVRSEVRGEAVAVDLPGGQVMFALMERAAGLPFAALKPQRYSGEYAKLRETSALKQTDRIGVVPRDAYPKLVTFGDPNNPRTVKLIDPDNLASILGERVRLRRITVEMTSDPITSEIEKRLPWLPDHYDKMLDGQRLNNSKTLANSLNQGAFSQGLLDER